MSKLTSADLVQLVSKALESSRGATDGSQADAARAVDLLKQLQKVTVTAKLLKETEAGKKISKLKKHDNSLIAEAALAVIEAWKGCVKKDASGEQNAAGGDSQGKSDSGTGSKPASASASTKPKAKQALRSQPKSTGDGTRDKIRQMLAEALMLAMDDVEDGDPAKVAEEVEDALYRQNGGVTSSYKSKYRSINFNLRDANNPDFRRKVLSQELPPDVLTEMTSEQMASDARRVENEKIRDHMKKECERGNNAVATTDAFQCGKCKQRKCTYYQMQTRSADEPMTTFMTCTVCGNKWKFC